MKLILSLMMISSVCLACQAPLFNHKNAKSLNLVQQITDGNSSKPTNECQFSFPQAGLCARIEWTQKPTEDKGGQFNIWFWNLAQGGPQGPFVSPNAAVGVKLWMGSMGHGSAPVKVSTIKDQSGRDVVGRYVADEVSFVMPGDWEIWIQLKENGKVIEKAKIDINVD